MNWIVLKALHNLYQNGQVKCNDTLNNSGEIAFLANSLNILDIKNKMIYSLGGFKEFYEAQYLNDFNLYFNFLEENELLKRQSRFEEEDIKVLIKIKSWKKNGVLEELRQQIIAADESQRGVSLMFFKNEKYLDEKPSLVAALKKILEVETFSNEKDQQYIYKLECINPKVIVLCENLDFLTKPNKPRQYSVELWYAGGKNVNKLNYATTRGLPIYYSCDWDYDGLFIIYPLVKKIIPNIQLLNPTGCPKGIEETDHASDWKSKNILELLSMIPEKLFTESQKKLIKELVETDSWIIEESNNLIEMIEKQIPNFLESNHY